MDTIARIQTEVKRLPDHLAREVLDFILFLEHRYDAQPQRQGDLTWDGPELDTLNWRFDREEANAR